MAEILHLDLSALYLSPPAKRAAKTLQVAATTFTSANQTCPHQKVHGDGQVAAYEREVTLFLPNDFMDRCHGAASDVLTSETNHGAVKDKATHGLFQSHHLAHK
jgi:hypothetical protein